MKFRWNWNNQPWRRRRREKSRSGEAQLIDWPFSAGGRGETLSKWRPREGVGGAQVDCCQLFWEWGNVWGGYFLTFYDAGNPLGLSTFGSYICHRWPWWRCHWYSVLCVSCLTCYKLNAESLKLSWIYCGPWNLNQSNFEKKVCTQFELPIRQVHQVGN